LINNPNHIGCHTLGHSESFFKGTQEIEREVIGICAEDILKGKPNGFDGYVASGGTEANLEAIWTYRNYFKNVYNASQEDICILCSEDSHYSMIKAANVFNIDIGIAKVHSEQRTIDVDYLNTLVVQKKEEGKKYFIVVVNMMTTMFGSVDDVDNYIDVLDNFDFKYKIHVDGAFGGFFYPFTEAKCKIDFSNPKIDSVTLDAHKMLQAPYGTGIFLIRKEYIKHVTTSSASYVEGEDSTLIGSRSGANAIAIWMILMTYGPYGWDEKIAIFLKRTSWLVERLKNKKIAFYRHEYSNIVTIKSNYYNRDLADEYGLVPEDHHNQIGTKLW
jgi:glutamate/tyrosine decarboxylase-like PLP-dependent enzyme